MPHMNGSRSHELAPVLQTSQSSQRLGSSSQVALPRQSFQLQLSSIMEEQTPEDALPLLAPRKRPKKRSVLFTVCPFILANEFCERLAYYGLCTNLVNYFTNVMHIGSADAAIQVSIWSGVCYTTPLLGAYLADSLWGRYKTIMVFSSVYVMGMLLMVTSAGVPGLTPTPAAPHQPKEAATTLQLLVLYSGLYTVALGTGGIKPCVSAFGADQFDENHPQDRREKESFFNWFYFAINVGALIASTVIVYIQEKVAWSVGFALPAVAMLCAITCFVMGSRRYRHVAPTGSPLARVVAVVCAALKNGYTRKRPSSLPPLPPRPFADDMSDDETTALGFQGMSPKVDDAAPSLSNWLDNAVHQVPRTRSLKWLEQAIGPEPAASTLGPAASRRGKGFTVQQVEEVKLVIRLLPIFFTTMGYWAVYSQMSTMFVVQGGLMNQEVNLLGAKLYIPSASMSSLDTLAVIVLIPVYDSIIEPGIRSVLGYKMTLLQKIGWGLVLSILSMLSAAWVESQRLAAWHSTDSPPHPKISILWQTFQYTIVGASEVLASVGQLEFFYDQAPDVMRSFAMALQLFSTAMGSYMSGFLVSMAQSLSHALGQNWLPENLNYGRLDCFFLFIAALMTLNTLVYVWVAMKFEPKLVPHKSSELPAPHPPTTPGPQPSPHSSPTPAVPVQIARAGYSESDESEEIAGGEVYSRSLAYVPESPALPAPFR